MWENSSYRSIFYDKLTFILLNCNKCTITFIIILFIWLVTSVSVGFKNQAIGEKIFHRKNNEICYVFVLNKLFSY